MVEKVIGRILPSHAQIHHFRYGAHPIIVVCEDQAYHDLLERRHRALVACGHVDWKRCRYCREWDTPEAVSEDAHRHSFHLACAAADVRHRRASGRMKMN